MSSENIPWSSKPKINGLSLTDLLQRRTPSRTVKNQEISIEDVLAFVTSFGSHTGAIKDMQKSINGGDATRFDIASGTAIKIDKSNPTNILYTLVEFPGLTGQLDTNLTNSFSHLYMDPDTQIVTTELLPPDLADIHDRIYLGVLLHTGGVITAIVDSPIFAYGSSTAEITEMVLGGGITIFGGNITANGANLKLDLALGVDQQFGRGRQFDPNSPDSIETAAQTPVPVGNFIKTYEDAGGNLVIDASTNDVDPTMFNEDNLGTLETVSNNQFTVFSTFYAVLPGGLSRTILYYDTEEFSDINIALSEIDSRFKEHVDTIRLSPRANIAVRNNVVDLTAGLASGLVKIERKLRRV